MSPYGCIAMGNQIGMIEVVVNSRTVASIQKDCGGSWGAFRDELLHDWLRRECATADEFAAAVENFTRSCAGYCVVRWRSGTTTATVR